MPKKLSCGGGEGIVHSSDVAYHGLSEALRPFAQLQIKLTRKISCPAIVTKAIHEMTRFIGITDLAYSRPACEAYRHGAPAIPITWNGTNIALTPMNVIRK